MGASHSTPPPLVEVNAPGGKVLVPPGTAFTVHPPSYARSRSDPYTRGPVYTPCPPPYRGGRQQQQRPRPRPHRRYGGPDINISEGSEDSDSTRPDMNMMEGMSPRGMRRQTSRGYPGGMMGGGGGMPGMRGMRRRGGGVGDFDELDPRPRSAPEMQMGGYPGVGGVPMGMHGNPQMGGGMGGLGGMGMMGGMQPPGMPPEYTPNPSMPRFGVGGGMPGAGMNPYANHPGAASSQSSRSSPDPPQAARRPTARKSSHYEHIPMGVYANGQKPRRSPRRAEPQTSARLNRGQAFNEKVGPSGGEWLEGDNPWLDACTCTTGCNCRKSQRVLYRGQHNRHQGSDSDDGEDRVLTSGEIRYILKTDLGRDCGDHSGCKKKESSDSDKDEKSKKKNKKKNKKEDKRRKEQLDEFKDDILEALDERLRDLRKDSRQRGKSMSPARQPFGGPGIGPSAFMMNEMNMDPRMAQQMGMRTGDPYGAGRIPPGMADTTGKRPMHHGMAMGGMGGMEGMGGMGGMSSGMGLNGLGGFENDMSDMGDMGMMGDAYMQSGMMNKKGMRPNFMAHRGARAGRQFSNGGMGMDMGMDKMGAIYAKAMGAGRGGMMMGGRRSGGGRRAHVDSESDDLDLEPGPSMPSGVRQQAGRDGAGRGSRRPGNGDQHIPIRRDFGGSPLGRVNGSQDRGKQQPRVDTDDDDA